MASNQNLIQNFIDDQLKQWEKARGYEKKRGDARRPPITVSMEAGSGGSVVAQRIAERLGFDLFHREIIQAIAQSGHISADKLEVMEKARYSGVQDFIASLLNDRYLWPGVYLDHLKKVVVAVGKRGGAVIVGRGALFILPRAETLSVRVVAPRDVRVQNVSRTFKVSAENARKRIANRDSKRADFVKNTFNVDIEDAIHYDVILNTGKLSIEEAAETVCAMWCKRNLSPE